ncbi:hypothetical protein ACT8ZV_09465 [Nocardioides sp. MAHUQ-72]|uniref:hypothetical protein n=1 Tax=unclassified Nocardioides TaxID=2615069 RepID=UPI00360EA32F
MEGIVEPIGRELAAQLRRAVLEHATSEQRRTYAPLVHVGVPDGPQALFAPEAGEPEDAAGPSCPEQVDGEPIDRVRLDHGLRTDVMAALLRRAAAWSDAPLVWLTRPGEHTLQDVDAAWLSAARAATGEAGLPLTLVVVTRGGWWDPRSGASRTWRRLRAR